MLMHKVYQIQMKQYRVNIIKKCTLTEKKERKKHESKINARKLIL